MLKLQFYLLTFAAKTSWDTAVRTYPENKMLIFLFQRNRANRKQREKEQKADAEEVGSSTYNVNSQPNIFEFTNKLLEKFDLNLKLTRG